MKRFDLKLSGSFTKKFKKIFKMSAKDIGRDEDVSEERAEGSNDTDTKVQNTQIESAGTVMEKTAPAIYEARKDEVVITGEEDTTESACQETGAPDKEEAKVKEPAAREWPGRMRLQRLVLEDSRDRPRSSLL